MKEKSILFLSATELASKIRLGNISSVKVVEAFFEQIEKHNTTINAVITLNKTNAILKAKKADQIIKDGGELGLLHGVPITIKDSYTTKGIKTTAGFLPYKDMIPDSNSVVVNLLEDEGAIIIGKTNLPTLASDLQTNNPIFGSTNNPWDTTRTVGGSSGGCAAALASGMTPLSFGSDLAGSIRQPSSFCGVFGLKTTYGVISKEGHIPPLPTEINGMHALAALGPLARSIDDLELALHITAKSSPYDRNVFPLISPVKENSTLSDLKIAWMDNFDDVIVCDEIKDSLHQFVEKLKKAGATVVKSEPLNFNYTKAWELWGEILGMMGEYNSSNFSKKIKSVLANPTIKNIPMAKHLFETHSISKYMIAINKQHELITQMDNFLSEYDVWLCPVSSTVAFKHHKPSKQFGIYNIYNEPLKVNQKNINYTIANQSYATIFNLTGNPSLSMPIDYNKDGLPIGIQVIAKRYEDFRLLKIAKLLNQYSKKMNYPLL